MNWNQLRAGGCGLAAGRFVGLVRGGFGQHTMALEVELKTSEPQEMDPDKIADGNGISRQDGST